MANGNSETADEPGCRTLLEERVSADKRQFLRMVLGSITAYSVPLMASFSMAGLRIGGSGEALAQIFVCNQLSEDPPMAELDGEDVVISWPVGCFSEATFEARADVTAVYACRNRGGVFVGGHDVLTVNDIVSTSATVPGTGELTIRLTLKPPPPPRRACPPGLNAVVVEISYENIVLEGGPVFEGIPDVVPSSLSAVFYEV
jgi:hypothetical protein